MRLACLRIALAVTLASLLLLARAAYAQSGPGYFVLTPCGNISNPQLNATVCTDPATGTVYVWQGATLGYQSLLANGLSSLVTLQLLSPVTLDGTSSINNFNLNGTFNVKSYGTKVGQFGNLTTKIVATTAGSACLNPSTDFVSFSDSQNVAVANAGAATTLATPGAPTVTVEGTAGAVTCEYKVTALDASGGETVAGAAGTTAACEPVFGTGAGTAGLSTHDYDYLSWTAVTNAVAYKVYGCTGAACSATNSNLKLLSVVPDAKFFDMGFANDSMTSPLASGIHPPASSNTRDHFFSTVLHVAGEAGNACAGNQLQLAANVTATLASTTLFHDDSTPILAALAAANNGGTVIAPASANYSIVKTLKVSAGRQLRFIGDAGKGPGASNTLGGTTLNAVGLDGAPLIEYDDCANCSVENMILNGSTTAPSGITVPSAAGVVSASTTASGLPGGLAMRGVAIVGVGGTVGGFTDGVAWTLQNGVADANNANADLSDVRVVDIQEAAFYTGQRAAVGNRLQGAFVNTAPVACRTAGGSFEVVNSRFTLTAGGLAFDIQDGTQTTANVVSNLMTDDAAELLHASANVTGASFLISNSDLKGETGYPIVDGTGNGGNTLTPSLDFLATGSSVFRATNSRLHPNAGATLNFTSSTTDVVLQSNNIGDTALKYNGGLRLVQNNFVNTLTLTNIGSGTLDRLANLAGGMTANSLSTPLGPASGGTGTNAPAAVGTLPTCNAAANGELDTVTDSTNTCVAGNALTGAGANNCAVACNGTSWNIIGTAAAVGGGTVTSVALTMPSIFGVTGSPIVGAGTLAVSFNTQAANLVFAGPGSGGTATPTFRALVNADLPTGLGVMTTLGDTIYGASGGTATRLAGNLSSTKNFLTQTGTGAVSAAPTWGTIAAADLPNLAGDVIGPYGSNTAAKLNGSTPGGSCTNQFVTALSTSAIPTCTTDTLASAYHANQGTTTTVLHGNAAGNPSWAAVSLTADVTGLLPIASGGTGSAGPALTAGTGISITGSWPNNTITLSTPVSVSNGGTGDSTLTTNGVLYGNGTSAISITAQGAAGTVLHGNGGAPTFTAVSLTADVSGTLPKANGGTASATGATSLWAGLTTSNITALPTTVYLPLSGAASGGITTEDNVRQPAAQACTFSGLRVDGLGTVQSGSGIKLTVRKNETNTFLTCTILSGASTCADTSDSFTVAAGDLLDLQAINSGTATLIGYGVQLNC